MVVVLVLVAIWAAVLVPPAVRLHQSRRDAFLGSFVWPPTELAPPPPPRRSSPVQRRRRIAGGLLVAMAVTLLVGLLPTFRVLLVVHLFLVDSFLAYVALLAHMANRAARPARGPAVADVVVPAPESAAVPVPGAAGGRRWWRRVVPRPALLGELGPVAPTG